MPLLTNDGLIADHWTHLDDERAPPTTGPFTVSYARWLASESSLRRHSGPVGVRLEPGDDPLSLAGVIGDLSCVVLRAPKFKDGRLYSQAYLLRQRLAFRGEIRATGHLLPDQLLFLRRCGVTSVEVSADVDVDVWLKSATRFQWFYQQSALDEEVAHQQRHLNDARAGRG